MNINQEKTNLLRGLGAQVRAFRMSANLTIKDLADKAAMSPRFLIQLESGKGNISIAGLSRVAAVLERPLQELLPVGSDGSVRSEIWRLTGRLSDQQLEPVRRALSEVAGHPQSRFIALIGLRGAGKSTIGPSLANRLQMDFVEVDALVEQEAGLSLSEIFLMHGEEYYRRLEREALTKLLSTSSGCVLAPGGSVVVDQPTWRLVKQRCFTVWLHATPEEFMKRLRRQGDTRPMRGNFSAMAELKSILARREHIYAEADLTIRTTNKAPTAVIAQIVKTIAALDPAA